MASDKIKIVFMGTPEFAVPALQLLSEEPAYDIKAVYTQPDKPVGRKQLLTPPPVKVLAESKGIPVLQPAKIRKNQEVLDHLSGLEPDFIIVVAYGKILPQSILDIPKIACVNIHGSLLEKYRGAAPIQWAIANGESETGITTMLMDAGMDTGDILLQESVKIEMDDNTETLSKKLSAVGARLLLETLPGLLNKTIKPRKQDDALATMAPIINKPDGEIDWNKSAVAIYNLSRAFNPWPSTYTFYDGVTLKVSGCLPVAEKAERRFKAGQITEIRKEGIVVATGDGLLLLTRVQLSGSKEMHAADFARGHRIEPGYVFENVLMC